MKNKPKLISGSTFHISALESLGGNRQLWLNSHLPLASFPAEAKRVAKQLRDAAEWVETVGLDYLKKKS